MIAGGFTATYERLGHAFRSCQEENTVGAFHEWRKRAKYHRYHLELLRGAYPAMIEPWIDEMHRLTDALGDDHDLSVLTARVRAHPQLFEHDEADAIVVLADDRSAVLRRSGVVARRATGCRGSRQRRRPAARLVERHEEPGVGSGVPHSGDSLTRSREYRKDRTIAEAQPRRSHNRFPGVRPHRSYPR